MQLKHRNFFSPQFVWREAGASNVSWATLKGYITSVLPKESSKLLLPLSL